MRIGLLLTEFPNQTSISMWRVGDAIRKQGNHLQIISTRKSNQHQSCHKSLEGEIKHVKYAWPPTISDAFMQLFTNPGGTVASIKYIQKLNESSVLERLKLLPLLFTGASLARYTRQQELDHLLVHSLANGAHLANFTRLMGGPEFSLRLGGDLEAYGKDHKSKFKNALFSLPASLNNKDQILEKQLIPASRILTTWLGVDTDRFKPNEKNSNPPNSTTHLVTVARLNHTKGHSYALKAIKQLTDEGLDLNYTIAGSGPNEPNLRAEVEALELTDKITFTGHIDESSAIQLLQNSDIFLLSSFGIGEASPVSLIEAMSCGLPAVCSDIGGTPQIITHNKDGFLTKQENSEEIASAIKFLATHKDARNAMGAAARESAVHYFACSRVAAVFIEAIESLKKDPSFDLNTLSPITRKLEAAKG